MALEITLAGEVTICAEGDTPSVLSSARARVAFAMLTLERARGVTSDLLAEAVWSDRLPRTWDSALRTVVSEVRRFVAQALPTDDDPLPAVTRRYRLLLPDDVVVDVEQAEARLTQGQAALAAGDQSTARRLSQQAADVLRAPFLPDHHADWVTAQQERLARLLVTALETTSQAAGDLGDGAAALAAAEEAIERAPLRESAHRCRMAAHLAAGNRAEALRAYQHLRRVLADELGTDPSPETEAAYLALLGATPAGGQPALRPVGTSQTAWSAPARSPAGSPVPLVGRDVELDLLGGAWHAAVTSGTCQVALVTGDAGIGKTRLTVEAAHRASGQGGLVLLGRCERDAVVPYQPFVELLDGFAAALPDEQLPQLDRVAKAELAAVFPAFATAAAGVRKGDKGGRTAPSPKRQAAVPGHGAGATSSPARLFDAVADLLVAATADRPVAVVLDDLQWASTDTQLLLRHLLARAAGAPLLVVAVARDLSQLAPPLSDSIRALERQGRLHRVALDGLGESDIHRLAEQVLPGPDHDAGRHDLGRLARTLLSDTSGNPFLVTELLRAYRDAGQIPPAVHDRVTDMLATLDRPATDLLRAAAVAGTTFEIDLVAAAADLDELAALDALDAALDARLVREVPALPARAHQPRFRFSHEIVQRTLYQQLATPRRRLLHGRLADAVESRRGDDLDEYAPLLARHRSAAAGPAGDPRAVLWSRAAGAQANGRRAIAEAMRLYQQALEHVPADDVGLRAEVLGELGMTQMATGDPAGEGSLLEAALQGRGCGRFDVAAWTCLCLADLARHQPGLRATAATLVDDVLGDIDGARGLDPAALAAESPAPVDPLVQARLLAHQVHLGRDAAPAPAAPRLAPSEPAAARLAAGMDVLRDHLLTLGGPGQLYERQHLADDLAALADVAGDPVHGAIAAHHHAALRALTGGGPTLAALQLEGPGTELVLAEHEVALAVTQGRFDAARAVSHRMMSSPPDEEHLPLHGGISPRPGTVVVRQMMVGRWLQHALRLASVPTGGERDRPDDDLATGPGPADHGVPGHTAQPGSGTGEGAPDDGVGNGRLHDDEPCPAEQALTAVSRGQHGTARLTVQALAAGTTALPDGDRWLHSAGVLGLAATELTDPALAGATYDLLAPHAGLACGIGYRSFVGTVTFHLGRLAAVAGDHAEAERQLVEALQQHSDAGARPWIALTQRSLAEVLDARGRAYDREWISALRSESEAIVRTLH